MKKFTMLLTGMLAIATGVPAIAAKQPKQCFAVLGESTAAPGATTMTPSSSPRRGAALIALSKDGGSAHLYFLKDSQEPFDKMSSGASFDDVSRLMRDQGTHPVTLVSQGMSFDNGLGPNKRQVYSITLDPKNNT
jgi:hypothetical protein